MKRTITLLLALTFFAVPAAYAAPDISAKSAIVMNAETGEVIYEKNPDVKMQIASTTKILTALVTLENTKPGDSVKIKREWTGIEGSSMYLKPDETLTVSDLLYGLLMESGNDAATALAGFVAGGEERFAALMNAKADSLGCANSHFVNPHGLDADGHLSTARDMALITQAAMENETFCKIVATKYITVAGRTMKNHNRLLWDYEGTLGVKTGYTQSAGRSLVSCAQRDGIRFICVTLADPDDWQDHAALYDEAFNAYTRYELKKDGAYNITVPVISGIKDTVELCPDRDYSIVVPRGGEVVLTPETPQFIYAAAVRGGHAGTLIVTVNGEAVARVPLVCKETVMRDSKEKLSTWERIKRAWFYANSHTANRGFGLY